MSGGVNLMICGMVWQFVRAVDKIFIVHGDKSNTRWDTLSAGKKTFLSNESDTRILQSIYFAYVVGIICSYSNRIKTIEQDKKFWTFLSMYDDVYVSGFIHILMKGYGWLALMTYCSHLKSVFVTISNCVSCLTTFNLLQWRIF